MEQRSIVVLGPRLQPANPNVSATLPNRTFSDRGSTVKLVPCSWWVPGSMSTDMDRCSWAPLPPVSGATFESELDAFSSVEVRLPAKHSPYCLCTRSVAPQSDVSSGTGSGMVQLVHQYHGHAGGRASRLPPPSTPPPPPLTTIDDSHLCTYAMIILDRVQWHDQTAVGLQLLLQRSPHECELFAIAARSTAIERWRRCCRACSVI